MIKYKKKLEDLKLTDLKKYNSWLLDDSNKFVSVHELENLEQDIPLICLTEFELKDGSKFEGYCFLYEQSGFVILLNEHVKISDWYDLSLTKAKILSSKLSKDIDDVFPIKYRCSVKLFGQEQSGEIHID